MSSAQLPSQLMWFTSAADGSRATGSTVRLYDPAADAWHVVWFSPTGTTCALTGRPDDGGETWRLEQEMRAVRS